MFSRKIQLIIIFILILIMPTVIYAHGVVYEFVQNKVCIKVSYESGEAFYPATVKVYRPDEKKVSMKSKTDENGFFSFEPDIAGKWILMFQDSSGHGTRVNVNIKDDLTLDIENSVDSISVFQKIIMGICVIWGFVGTALFFIKRRKQ